MVYGFECWALKIKEKCCVSENVIRKGYVL